MFVTNLFYAESNLALSTGLEYVFKYVFCGAGLLKKPNLVFQPGLLEYICICRGSTSIEQNHIKPFKEAVYVSTCLLQTSGSNVAFQTEVK